MEDMIKIDSIFSEANREVSSRRQISKRSKTSHRPMRFEEYPGQNKVKRKLKGLC